MRRFLRNPRSVLFLALAVAGLLLNGCASTEPDNLSTRPWNAPRNSDYGLPGMMPGGY
jgi:hypothetical protein